MRHSSARTISSGSRPACRRVSRTTSTSMRNRSDPMIVNRNKRLRVNIATIAIVAIAVFPLTAQRRSPVAPRDELVKNVVNEAYALFKHDMNGKNADYIPYLAKVDSKLFGIAVVTTDNKAYTLGDVNYAFSIQSISKVFTLALAMQERG